MRKYLLIIHFDQIFFFSITSVRTTNEIRSRITSENACHLDEKTSKKKQSQL